MGQGTAGPGGAASTGRLRLGWTLPRAGLWLGPLGGGCSWGCSHEQGSAGCVCGGTGASGHGPALWRGAGLPSALEEPGGRVTGSSAQPQPHELTAAGQSPSDTSF